MDWARALGNMSEGTEAAGDSGSSRSRNHGSLSQRGLLWILNFLLPPEKVGHLNQKLLSGQPPVGSLIAHVVKPGSSSHPGAPNLCHFLRSRYF